MEGKNGFLLYSDYLHTVSKLPDDVAGRLFKHLLEYVNDMEPITEELLVEVTFEPIKRHLDKHFKYQFSPNKKFAGYTECFDLSILNILKNG